MSNVRYLQELGSELDRAARRTLPGRPPRRPRRFGLVAAVTIALLLAGVAAAAVVLIREGKPLPAPHAGDLPPEALPMPGSVHLAGLDAPDPAGGAPWDIRLSRSRTGETCTAVGQVVAGRFGVVGLDGVFRALPLGGVDACGARGAATPVLAGARVFVGKTPAQARTVVNGVAGPRARSVTAYGPDGARPLPLGRDGSFVTAYAGYVEDVRPRIVVVDRDGRRRSIAFAQTSLFETADPQGGAPWSINGGFVFEPGAYPDQECVAVSRETAAPPAGRPDVPPWSSPAFAPPFGAAHTPTLCGRLGTAPMFVAMRRFNPGGSDNGQGGYAWGNQPARTVVYGAAAPRVATLTLSAPGGTRAVAIDRQDGAFAAVLDGHVDPRSLTLTARLRDGQTVHYTRSTGVIAGNGKPVAEPPVPPYKSVPAPTPSPSPPPFEDPIRATIVERLHAADPAGGPAWVLRSWQGRTDPRAAFGPGMRPSRFSCFQVGVKSGDRLVQPVPGGKPVALTVGGNAPGIGPVCTDPSALARFGSMVSVSVYPDNPAAYAPRPLRVVVGGVLQPGASGPVLLGAGASRPLASDSNGAFLTVLPGRFWNVPLHVSVRLSSGRTRVSPVRLGWPARLPATPDVRAPDPDGGAPWGFAAWGFPRGLNCTATSRVVDGQFAGIDPSAGQLRPGPEGYGCEGEISQQPLRLDAQSQPPYGLAAFTTAQIQRRTLPGRTIIAGTATANVISVTLRTPRDIRTLRPTGPEHAFLAVYDGAFYRGKITATARLRTGQTITQLVIGAGVPGSSAFPTPQLPPPAIMLRNSRRQLATLRQQARQNPGVRCVKAPAFTGPPHHAHTHCLPPPSGFIANLERIIATLRAHLDYVRHHPGALPPR